MSDNQKCRSQLKWVSISSLWVSQITTLQMKIRVYISKTKCNFLCEVFAITCFSFLTLSLSLSVKEKHPSFCLPVCATVTWIFFLLSLLSFTCMFGPWQLKILFELIIRLRNGSLTDGSLTDPISNTLYLGLPYFRLPLYFSRRQNILVLVQVKSLLNL